jgi:predicted DNA-binding antitoxin AbrB/MazE fold protein
MKTVEAVYENGVFRPLGPVELPEHTRVAFELREVRQPENESRQDAVYEVVSRRHHSGHHDTAERHNEHQP